MIDSYEYNASYSDEEALKQAIMLSRSEYENESTYITLSNTAPAHLCCPLTKCLFCDPVQVIHGNTYERAAILQWFSISNIEPLTGEILFVTALFENEDVLAQCKKYLRSHSQKFRKVKTRKRR